MKTLLAVVVLKSGLGVFTHRTYISKDKKVVDELNLILHNETGLYEQLGAVDSILLVDNNEVFARWSCHCGWTDDNGGEIKD